MATKQRVNCTTGLSEEVEMIGDELAAFEHQRANPPIVYVGQQTITVTPPDDPAPLPPSRDDRLMVAVEQAKVAVEGGAFTKQQAATLAAVFDGLGAAITGVRDLPGPERASTRKSP